MKKIILCTVGALAALMTLTADAAWTYNSSTQVLENDDWSLSSVTLKNSVLTFSGTITRKEGSESTTIDFTSCRTDCGYPVRSISAKVQSSVPCTRFIAPDATTLCEQCFYGNTVIEEIEISPSITSFAKLVFKNTSSLKTLRPTVFPSLTSIPISSFECSTVEGDFEFPAVSKLDGGSEFLRASKITSLKFATLTQATKNFPFCGMTSLTNFYAPRAVDLNGTSFYHSNYSSYPCSKLESVTFSADMTSIPPFNGCTSLKSITPTEFSKVTSSPFFQNCSRLVCDLSFPLVTTLSQNAFKNTGVTSLNLTNLASLAFGCFGSCANLTNVTILGSTSAIPNLTVSGVPDNFTINWLSEDVPSSFSGYGENSTFVPANSLSPCILRVPITEDNRAAWEAFCTKTAANFTDAHRAISNYPRVAAKAIGFVGTPNVNASGVVTSISPVKPKGIFWIVDSTEAPSVDVAIQCPVGVQIGQVMSGGFEVQANGDGTYTIELAETMDITYVPTENRLFADGTDSVTVMNLAPVATVESSVCPKASVLAYARIGDTLYRTLQEAANVGGEVALNWDLSLAEPVTVAAGKTVSLDLSGKTLSASGTGFAVVGSLTVKGTGVVDTLSPFSGAGTVQLMGGTYRLDVGALCTPGYVATAQGTEPETWVVAPDTNVSTLTLDTATFAAEHLSAVEVVTTAPVACTTNGTVISWQIAKNLPFSLVYTVLGSYRFADRGKTASVAYATGIAADTAANVADVPVRVYHPTWSWDKSAGTCTDGNWVFTCSKGNALVTVGIVEGIALTAHQAGCGDLDLLTFKDDVGENVDVIKLSGTLFRYKPNVVTNVCAPAVLFIDHRVFGSESDYARPLKSAEFSPDIETISQYNIGSCRSITNFWPRVFPKLTTFADSFAYCTGLTGDFSMPLVTTLPSSAFSNSRITSLHVPRLATIPQVCFYSCTALTNVTVQGSTNQIPREIISGVPDNFVLNWLGEDVPASFFTYGETSAIVPGNNLSPCILRVTITEENRAAWESICTTTRRNFTAAHRAISNYPRVARHAIGFVGTPSMTAGVVTSISPVKPKGIFWVVDNKPDPGLIVIIR